MIDASSPGVPWTRENCCGQAKVDGLEQALDGVEAWVTGIRREQSPTRADSAKLERDEKRGIWKLNPLADWSDKDLWGYIFKHDLPYNPLMTMATIRSAARRARCPAVAATAAGRARTRRSAASISDERPR